MKQIKHINIMKKEYLTPLIQVLAVSGKQPLCGGGSIKDYEADNGGGDGYGFDPDSD